MGDPRCRLGGATSARRGAAGRPRRSPARAAAIALALVFAVGAARPAAASGRAAFSVEVTAAAGETWRADALAAALRIDLVDDHLALAPPGGPAQLAVRGELAGEVLRYAIAHAAGAPARGELALRGADRRAIASALRDELRRVARPIEGPPIAPPIALPAPDVHAGALAALGALGALVGAPLALGAALLRGRRSALAQTRALRQCGLAVVAVIAAAWGLVAHGEHLPAASPLVMPLGGLAWGALVAAALPRVAPPLPGLHRVAQRELGAVAAAWLGAAARRAVAAAILALAATGALAALAAQLGSPPLITFGALAPALALAARLAGRATVEVLALRLDVELVDGDASASQPWHAQIRAYLVGYLRRANLAVDEHLLDRVRFLPGRLTAAGAAAGAEVVVYGGGLTHSRVVIERAALEHALAPYGRPHDHLVPRVSTLHWTHWSLGLVLPSEPEVKPASLADREPQTIEVEAARERSGLGEPPTLSGIIEPTALDPRTSYRPAEDPLWLDWDPGEEYDGTDAADKDYLFGALIRALGEVQRREDRGGTLALAWRRWIGPTAGGRLGGRVARALWAPGAARRAALGDVAAVLGGARHHLAQYLAWQLWRQEAQLTARAYVPELEQRSRALIAAIDRGEPAAPGAYLPAAATARARLAQLRGFLAPSAAPRTRRARVALGALGVAGAAAAATLAVQAVRYRDTWHARVADQDRAAAGSGSASAAPAPAPPPPASPAAPPPAAPAAPPPGSPAPSGARGLPAADPAAAPIERNPRSTPRGNPDGQGPPTSSR
jgi:hypothetical protein